MDREKIKCPACTKGRVADVNKMTTAEAISEKIMQFDWGPDFYVKCPVCGDIIAIKKVS